MGMIRSSILVVDDLGKYTSDTSSSVGNLPTPPPNPGGMACCGA
jgi:hypothetical protein